MSRMARIGSVIIGIAIGVVMMSMLMTVGGQSGRTLSQLGGLPNNIYSPAQVLCFFVLGAV